MYSYLVREHAVCSPKHSTVVGVEREPGAFNSTIDSYSSIGLELGHLSFVSFATEHNQKASRYSFFAAPGTQVDSSMMKRKQTGISTLVVLVTILCASIGKVCAFGVARSIFSRRAINTPKVSHIPLVPSSKLSSTASFKEKAEIEESLNRLGFKTRLASLRGKIRRKKYDSRVGRKAMVVSVASALVALLASPARCLAMGAMGGSTGPVAPMQRYDIVLIQLCAAVLVR